MCWRYRSARPPQLRLTSAPAYTRQSPAQEQPFGNGARTPPERSVVVRIHHSADHASFIEGPLVMPLLMAYACSASRAPSSIA